MEKKSRFSPEKSSPEQIRLIKEIYRKEEKCLGISPIPEKIRYDNFIRGLKPKFSGAGEQLRKSQDPSISRYDNP